MTLSLDARLRAFEYYLGWHSVPKVHKKLKAEGYEVSLATLQKWCREDKWVERADKTDKQILEIAASAQEILGETLERLKRMREPYDKEIDAGIKQDPQAVHGFLKINDQIIGIIKICTDRELALEKLKKEITPEQAKEVLERFMAILQEHPKVGAAIREHREELIKIFEQKMELE